MEHVAITCCPTEKTSSRNVCLKNTGIFCCIWLFGLLQAVPICIYLESDEESILIWIFIFLLIAVFIILCEALVCAALGMLVYGIAKAVLYVANQFVKIEYAPVPENPAETTPR